MVQADVATKGELMSAPPHTTLHVDPAGFRVPVPDGWEVVVDAQPGVPLIAVEPPADDEASTFRANLVVTIGGVGGLGFRDWQRGVDELMPLTLNDWHLIDLTHVTVGTLDSVRRVGHHVSPEGEALTLEQWAVLADGTGYTLSITAATSSYDGMADELTALGAGFMVEPGNAGPPVADGSAGAST